MKLTEVFMLSESKEFSIIANGKIASVLTSVMYGVQETLDPFENDAQEKIKDIKILDSVVRKIDREDFDEFGKEHFGVTINEEEAKVLLKYVFEFKEFFTSNVLNGVEDLDDQLEKQGLKINK